MKWISVKDLSPPIDNAFLAFTMDDTYLSEEIFYAYVDEYEPEYFEGMTYEKGCTYKRRLGIGENYRYQITHWMPLPKSPAELALEPDS